MLKILFIQSSKESNKDDYILENKKGNVTWNNDYLVCQSHA